MRRKIRVKTGNKNIRFYLTQNNELSKDAETPVLCAECAQRLGYKKITRKETPAAITAGVGVYKYTDGELHCTQCNNSKVVVKTPEEYEAEDEARAKEELENLHLVEEAHDYSCGFHFYSLSTRIDYDDWLKVKEYFTYYKSGWGEYSDVDFMGYEPHGWLTTQAEKVEKALSDLIKPENTLKARREERQKREDKKKELSNKKNMLKKHIDNIFDNAGEKPETIAIDETVATIYENPEYPWDIYGGGQKWIITKEHLYFIRNNGHDGDDWSLNNYETGGAGAIAYQLPLKEYNYLVKDIKDYLKYCEEYSQL